MFDGHELYEFQTKVLIKLLKKINKKENNAPLAFLLITAIY